MNAHAFVDRTVILADDNIYDDIHKKCEFVKQKINADNSLTKKVKAEAIKILNETYDRDKVNINSGIKRICESCKQECLATFYCEYCVRNHLKVKFSNWTSGNNDIDILIKKCQMETLIPYKIIEWIPYEKLRNINFLTKGGCSEVYTADWIDGEYDEWVSNKLQLKRHGRHTVILKNLGDVKSENRRWFEEAKSHLIISNKWPSIVKCYGLTQNTSNGNYMLVINKMDMDLRKFLQQNHNRLTWEKRIMITFYIVDALNRIHGENAIHRDLHSKNILYTSHRQKFYISDLGFCGPANRPLKSVYGNLPYIAPEAINSKGYTFKSDIYSIAMLMWEISSGQPPFSNCKHEYDLAMNIINGIRPKIVPGTPLEYKNLMEQCWDADPLKRPNIRTLWEEIKRINILYQNTSSKLIANNESKRISCSNSELYSTSKFHQFENLPEPRNATEEEQEEFHSTYNFAIPDNSKYLLNHIGGFV